MLQEHGFEIVCNALSPQDVRSVPSALEASTLERSRAGMRNALQLDPVRELSADPRLLCYAKQALGETAIPFRATLFEKSPQSNWLIVWHQDTALPLRLRRDVPGWGPWSIKKGVLCAHAPASALEQVLAIRVHLDDSTADNGPLRVLPGTHNLGVLTDDAIHDLVIHKPAIDCHLRAGGLLLMRPLLVHASSKTISGRSRRVLHIEYSSVRSFDGLELPV